MQAAGAARFAVRFIVLPASPSAGLVGRRLRHPTPCLTQLKLKEARGIPLLATAEAYRNYRRAGFAAELYLKLLFSLASPRGFEPLLPP